MTLAALLKLFLVIVGLAGIELAAHIYKHNRARKKLICPLRADCSPVIQSRYARLFGIPIEVLGMVYYAAISVTYILLFITGQKLPSGIHLALLLLTTLAFLFSVYLTLIQTLALRRWCSWCLISAGFCSLVFVGAIWLAGWTIKGYLFKYWLAIILLAVFILLCHFANKRFR